MKKGAISVETIIIIVLALLVLVIVAAAFSGGMAALWSRIINIGQTTGELSLSEAVVRCGNICADSKELFCTNSVSITDVGPRACRDIATCAGAPCQS